MLRAIDIYGAIAGLALFLTAGNAASAPAVRLAIVGSGNSTAAAVDVLTAELSHRTSVTLLERDQIEKVYREQSLSAGGADFLKLGQLLGADGLLLLNLAGDATHSVLEARLVAVKPGVVLSDERFPWPVKGVADWARDFCAHTAPMLPKLDIEAARAVPISVLNLHSSVNSEPQRVLEKEMTLLLIQRLSAQPEIFVLERRHLDQVFFEKQIQPETEGEFWTGRYLIDGTLDKDGFDPERVTLTARLSLPAAGRPPLTIEMSGPRGDPAKVVDGFVAKLLTVLKLGNNAVQWRPRDEADSFFAEAKWALQWGLFAEAQSAAESAWALGRHDEQTATLRIRACLDPLTPNHLVPSPEAYPGTDVLKPVLRAAELFNEDSPLLINGVPSTNVAGLKLGAWTLQIASGVLDEFYNNAEARPGNESELRELRFATRELAALLTGQFPSLADWARDVNRCKWAQGGLWFDTPEEALPMYRKLLESGSRPYEAWYAVREWREARNRPRLAGWSWEDRRRIPELLTRFADDLRALSNTELQLEGWYLTLELTPFDGSGHLENVTAGLCNRLWEARQSIYEGHPPFWLVVATEETLRHKYGIRDGYLEREPFAGFQQRLRKDYLSNAASFRRHVFVALFEKCGLSENTMFGYLAFEPGLVPASEARELTPLLQEFRTRFQGASYLDSCVGRFINANSPTSPPPAVAVSTLTNASPVKPETVSFVDWRGLGPHLQPYQIPHLKGGIYRDGKLWVQLSFNETPPVGQIKDVVFAEVDLRTGNAEAIPFPKEFGTPNVTFGLIKTMVQSAPEPFFEFADGTLIVSASQKLVAYSMQEKRWETLPVPLENGARVRAVGDKLYMATGNALLEYSPKTRTSKILASARRRPPVNSMDELNEFTSIVALPAGKLGLVSGKRFFTYTPETGAWREITLPLGQRTMSVDPESFDEGALLGVDAEGHPNIIAIWMESNRAELILERPTAPEKWGRGRDAEPLPLPRWPWPHRYPLDAGFVAVGHQIWALCIADSSGVYGPTVRSGLESVSDNQNAVLIHFEPGFQNEFVIPLRFERYGRPVNPANPFSDEFWRGEPVLFMHTPDGFLIVGSGLAGHWFVPKQVLESRLEPMRKEGRRDPTAEAARP